MIIDELKQVLSLHVKWLSNEPDGVRANLRYANLRYANLSGADLRYADLYDADLRYANLRYANLYGANLYDADLRYADLRYADLRYADLRYADLRYANLSGADLRYANLYDADLRYANLSGANLYGADLPMIYWNNDTIFYPLQCPESGSFIGWKKANGYIVKLEICEDALRSSATTRKCRCSKAKVLSIENLDGTNSNVSSIRSSYDINFIYTVGETVSVDNFDTNRWNECAPGIHFFITRDEAVKY